MNKGELKKLRTLKATKKMMEMAANDAIKREITGAWSYSHVRESYKYGLYMRCQTLNGILKVAFFWRNICGWGQSCPPMNCLSTRKQESS